MRPPIFTMIAASAVVLSAPAHAEGLYGKLEVGGAFDGKYDVPGPDAETKGGWQVGGALGTNVTPNVRVEGEFSHQRSDFKAGAAESKATFGLANAYYDFAPDAQVTPFVGAGLGFAKVDTGATDDTGFAYKATAGVATKFNDRVTGELAYRYTAAPDLKFGGADAKYHESAITAGVRFKLGQ